jgi:hypothetical protein
MGAGGMGAVATGGVSAEAVFTPEVGGAGMYAAGGTIGAAMGGGMVAATGVQQALVRRRANSR